MYRKRKFVRNDGFTKSLPERVRRQGEIFDEFYGEYREETKGDKMS